MKLPGPTFQQGEQPLPEGYEVLTRGPTCDVLIKSSVHKHMLKKASAEQRAGLKDLVERYVTHGVAGLPSKKFNPAEGWFPSSKDKRIRLEAFKPWQLRAYGFCEQFLGRRTFFITGADCQKKQDRADQDVLASAGKEAVRLHDELKSFGGSHASRPH